MLLWALGIGHWASGKEGTEGTEGIPHFFENHYLLRKIMRFIDPKMYVSFKKIFGANESGEILISFLNALLYAGEPVIEELEAIDPYLAAEIFGSKDTYLDVKATKNDGKTVLIAIQVLNVSLFKNWVF